MVYPHVGLGSVQDQIRRFYHKRHLNIGLQPKMNFRKDAAMDAKVSVLDENLNKNLLLNKAYLRVTELFSGSYSIILIFII